MHYIRKIAIAAVAGVAVSGIISSNQKNIGRLIHRFNRKQRIAKLKAWYQSQTNEIDEYAGMEVERYLIGHREHLLAAAKRKGYSQQRADDFIKSVSRKARKVIVTNQKAQLTKKYGEYLYEVDTNRAYEEELTARWLMRRTNHLADTLRGRGCHIDSLFVSLRITPPD